MKSTYKEAIDDIFGLCRQLSTCANRSDDETILRKFRDMTFGVTQVCARDPECKIGDYLEIRNYWKAKHEELREYLQSL